MSFGEGNLHDRIGELEYDLESAECEMASVRERCETYRKQLGGTNAALNRARQRVRELEAENAELRKANRELRDGELAS